MSENPLIPSHVPRAGDVVRDPASSDALAESLRAAYRREMTLPDDLARMIAALDEAPPRL